jgi:hypothetical protein
MQRRLRRGGTPLAPRASPIALTPEIGKELQSQEIYYLILPDPSMNSGFYALSSRPTIDSR